MPNSQTSLSLLNRLRNQAGDEHSWHSFVAIYGPRIRSWCLGWGLQSEDADDVTQNVLVAIVQQIENFEYDPNGRFRSWLKTVAYRAWANFLRKSSRNPARPNSAERQALLESVETREDFLAKMDQETERLLLDEAIINIRQRVKRETWQAFEATVLDGLSGAAAAEKLTLPLASVYKAKQRVQEMLKVEIRRIDQDFLGMDSDSLSNSTQLDK